MEGWRRARIQLQTSFALHSAISRRTEHDQRHILIPEGVRGAPVAVGLTASFFSLMPEHEMTPTLNDRVQWKRSVIASPRKLIYAYIDAVKLLVKQLNTDEKTSVRSKKINELRTKDLPRWRRRRGRTRE